MNQIAGSLKRSLKLKNYSKLIIKKKNYQYQKETGAITIDINRIIKEYYKKTTHT